MIEQQEADINTIDTNNENEFFIIKDGKPISIINGKQEELTKLTIAFIERQWPGFFGKRHIPILDDSLASLTAILTEVLPNNTRSDPPWFFKQHSGNILVRYFKTFVVFFVNILLVQEGKDPLPEELWKFTPKQKDVFNEYSKKLAYKNFIDNVFLPVGNEHEKELNARAGSSEAFVRIDSKTSRLVLKEERKREFIQIVQAFIWGRSAEFLGKKAIPNEGDALPDFKPFFIGHDKKITLNPELKHFIKTTALSNFNTSEIMEDMSVFEINGGLTIMQEIMDPIIEEHQAQLQLKDSSPSTEVPKPAEEEHPIIEQDTETSRPPEHKENKKGRKALYWMLGAGVLEAVAVVLPYQMGLTSSILGASASFSLPLLYAGLVLLSLSIGVIVWKIETSGTEQVAEDTITNQGTEADISPA
jgi:hypothetical protein